MDPLLLYNFFSDCAAFIEFVSEAIFFCFVVDLFFCIFGTYVIHYYTAFKFLKCLKFVSSFSSWNGRYGFHIPLSLQNWGNISLFFFLKIEEWFQTFSYQKWKGGFHISSQVPVRKRASVRTEREKALSRLRRRPHRRPRVSTSSSSIIFRF